MASLGGSTLAILPSHRPQQATGAVAGRACRRASSALLALSISLLGALSASAQETITVAWRDKAPYHYRENGVAQGFLLLRAQQVFARAAIPAVFIEEPAKRIWHDFEYGRKSFCSIGWYRLPEREQLVMSLYYEQELNLKEIGAVLGVSESRVCQIHGQALVRLRARLADWIAPDPDND